MPSFLSKVFGRKKDDRDSSPTNQLGAGELLGGKFEAISPNVSPSATHYLELHSDPPRIPPPDTDAEKEFGLPFFRTRSRPSSPDFKPKRLFDSLPPLSLDFDDVKDKSAHNGYIFEESNSEAIFSDSVLGQRQLNPMEALVLIRACSKAIISRGLETLGIMTPHWYSASPDVQRKLISKFLRSLDLSNSTATTTPGSPYITNFEDEVNFTRSIHDVAAVFRWGLRHVQLEGDSFGTDDGWYRAFLDAEAANGYPPKAFSEKLVPSLPASHLDLVVETLELFSSLAAFSESNSTSGSKLSKIFGLWLLTARRVEDKDDWRTFYARWERTGRMLEHLFLARIRDQSADQRMPTRLLELVHKYPYTHGLSSPTTDLQLLSYPQFTTALHPALLVRVQYEVSSQKHIPKTKLNPSVLLADAFSTKIEEGEFVELWAKITNAAAKFGTELPLSNVLANESLRLLSLVVDKSKDEVKSPSFSLISLPEPRQQRATSNGVASASPLKPTTDSAPITTAPLSPISIGGDWAQFSASGFLDVDHTYPPLASTLFDTDIEKTEPRDIPLPISRRSSKRAGRKSLEIPRSVIIAESNGDSSLEAASSKSSRQEVITASHLEVIELDEAFVDFWSDSLLDPIASDWPAFAVFKFKPTLVPELTFGTGDETTPKTLKWLVLEQAYHVKPRPVPSSPMTTVPTTTETPARPASPIAQSPSGRRLFNFWSMSRTSSTSSAGSHKTKRALKTPKIGEMGELIEEDEGKRDTINLKLPSSKKFKSLDLPGIRKSSSKKSDKLEEKAKSVDVARPEVTSTDVDAKATSHIVAATGVAAENPESDVKEVELSTGLEPVAELSEPVVVPEPTYDAPKHGVFPAEVALAEVEKADMTTMLATITVPEQIVDAGAAAQPPIVSVLKTTIVDERQAEAPSRGENDIAIEDDEKRPHYEVDQSLLVSTVSAAAESSSNQPLSLKVEQSVPISGIGESVISDNAVGVVAEEHESPEKAGSRVEISEAAGEELQGVSEIVETQVSEASNVEEVPEQTYGEPDTTDKPIVEVTAVTEDHQVPVKAGESERVEISGATENIEGPEIETGGCAPESFPLTEVPTTTLLSVQVTELHARINEPTEDDVKEEVCPAEVKSAALADADEVAAPVSEVIDHEMSVPALSLAEPVPIIVDEPVVQECSTEEISKAVPDAPREVIPSVETDVAIQETPAAVEEASGPLAEDVQAPGDPSPVIDNVVVQKVSPSSEPAVAEIPPISGDPSGPSTQVAEELPGALGIAVHQEISDQSADEGAAAAGVGATAGDPFVENGSEEIATESFVEPVIGEPQTQEAPDETAVEKTESFVEVPAQEFSANETEAPVEIFVPQPTEELSTEAERLAQITDIEGASVDEARLILEGHSQEVPMEEPGPADAPIEAGVPETREADDAPVALEISSASAEAEVTVAEPSSEESSEQPVAEAVAEISPAPEAAVSVEESSQEIPAFKETPTQPEAEETPLVEVQPPTEELPEEPAIDTKKSEELPVTEPEIPVEEPETTPEHAPAEVVGEPVVVDEAPLVEEITSAEKDEEVILDAPEREAISSTSVVPLGAGEAPLPQEETPPEVPQQAEKSLQPAADVPVVEPPPFSEVAAPPEESLADEITATSEEVRVDEAEPVVAEDAVEEETSETTTELKESVSETVAASQPTASEGLPPAEEANPVIVEDVTAELALGKVPPEIEAVVEVPIVSDVPLVEDASTTIEEPPTDEAFKAEESIDVAPAVVEEPALLADEAPERPKAESAHEDLSTPVVEVIVQEASLLDTSHVDEPSVDEPSSVAEETTATIEETITEEPTLPDEAVEISAAVETSEEPNPSAAGVEADTLAEASISHEKSPPNPDGGISTLVDEVVPKVEETAVVETPDPVEEVPALLKEPATSDDAEQPAATMADELLAGAAEENPEVASQPEEDASADSPEMSSALEPASEQHAEISEQEDNTTALPDEVPVGIDQPIHSQEDEQPTAQGGIIDEPVNQNAARNDSSVEKQIPDTPLASTTTEEEPAHTDDRNEGAEATANTLGPAIAGTTSISENAPTENAPSSTVDQFAIMEPSPELGGGPTTTEQSGSPAENSSAIPERIDGALSDANQPAMTEVPSSVEDRPLAGEPAVGELLNEEGHIYIATEATDTTIVAPGDEVDSKTVVDELKTSKPSEVVEMLKDDKVASDVQVLLEADSIAPAS